MIKNKKRSRIKKLPYQFKSKNPPDGKEGSMYYELLLKSLLRKMPQFAAIEEADRIYKQYKYNSHH